MFLFICVFVNSIGLVDYLSIFSPIASNYMSQPFHPFAFSFPFFCGWQTRISSRPPGTRSSTFLAAPLPASYAGINPLRIDDQVGRLAEANREATRFFSKGVQAQNTPVGLAFVGLVSAPGFSLQSVVLDLRYKIQPGQN